MIFNSLGSNYDLKTALRHLLSLGSSADVKALKAYLGKEFGAPVELYAQGRAALGRAVGLSGATQVIINGLTCYSVELAIKAAQAEGIFADIKSGGYHFDLDSLKKVHRHNPQVQAVVVQANYGLPIAIKPIKAYCQKHGLWLIEDLAHSIGMNYSDGPPAGSVADLVMLSFGRDKHIDSAGGGALVVRRRPKNYHPPTLKRQPRILTDRLYPSLSWLLRRSYDWPLFAKGLHCLLSKLGLMTLTGGSPVIKDATLPAYKAKLVLEQLINLKTEQKRRRQLWRAYGLAKLPKGANPLRCPVRLAQDSSLTMVRLSRAGYNLADQWGQTPIYPARYLKASAYQPGCCWQAESLGSQLLELPLHRQITPAKAKQIAEIIKRPESFKVVAPADEAAWQVARETWSETHFTSSWLYGQSQTALGNLVIRRLFYKDDQLLAIAQAVIRRARRGCYLELIGNPLFVSENDYQSGCLVVGWLRQFARAQACSFVRLWPRLTDSPSRRQFFRKIGLRQSPVILVYDYSSLLDLRQSEADLMAALRQQTRQAVRQSVKQGIRVESSTKPESFKELLESLEQTSSYQGFTLPASERIQTQYQVFTDAGQARVYHAYGANDQLLSSALVVFADKEVSYRFGAMTPAGRSTPGAYALQWQIICDAKAAGAHYYDLWGMAPPGANDRHRSAGYSTFKRGFGGQTLCYLPSYDLPIKPIAYQLVRLVETIRHKRRGH